MCCVCFLPIHCGHQIRWTYQPGSHRRKVTQDFSSTFFLRCVCVFSSHPFWTSMDVPAGVTQEEGHTGFLIHLPSAVRALIFVARRIQPFLSLVDREAEFLCTNELIVLHPLGIFFFFFLVFSEKNPVCRDRTHVPTCQKVTRCQLSYRGRPACGACLNFSREKESAIPFPHRP